MLTRLHSGLGYRCLWLLRSYNKAWFMANTLRNWLAGWLVGGWLVGPGESAWSSSKGVERSSKPLEGPVRQVRHLVGSASGWLRSQRTTIQARGPVVKPRRDGPCASADLSRYYLRRHCLSGPGYLADQSGGTTPSRYHGLPVVHKRCPFPYFQRTSWPPSAYICLSGFSRDHISES